jgi:hypothetical protein
MHRRSKLMPSLGLTLSLFSQSFPPRNAAGIIERLLTQTYYTVTLPLSLIIICRSVENASIVPNGEIILAPLEPYLQIMVLCNQLQEILLQDFALSLRHAINPTVLDLMCSTEERLPAGDGISTDNWMRGLEIEARILGSTTIIRNELCAVLAGDLVEVRLVVGSSKVFGNLLKNRGEPIIGFISGGPEGVAARAIGGQTNDFQNSVVRRDTLECDAKEL